MSANRGVLDVAGEPAAPVGAEQDVSHAARMADLHRPVSRQRAQQFKELASAGAGNRFDQEQAEADVASLEADLAAANAAEQQVRAKLAATTPDGELDEVAKVKAQIANAQAQLANARWELSQTEYRAPADGTVVSLALRRARWQFSFPRCRP